MANQWVVRTDPGSRESVILPSLEAGLLRQGWGYQEDQDLNVIGPIVMSQGRGALNADQKATWRRVQHFWSGHWDPVCEGDLILLPKIPKERHWRLVRVVGPYRFEPHSDSGDHGHVLPVEAMTYLTHPVGA